MSTIKTIEHNGATVNVESGRCQWNVKTASKFRSTLAKWHNADFDIANELNKRSDLVRKFNDGIATNEGLLEDLKAGKTIIGGYTEKQLNDEIADFKAKIEELNKTVKEFRDAQSDRIEKGMQLITDDLYKAYKDFAEDRHNEELRTAYYDAIAVFLSDNGVQPAHDSIVALVTCVGNRKASAKNKFKTGKHNAAQTKSYMKSVILGEICDYMGSALPLYKFQYVPMSEREDKKKNK